jgi:Ras-related GTP-binding protein C/D
VRADPAEASTIIPLEIWDCPGTTDPSGVDLTQFAALIFVIDIQVCALYLPHVIRTDRNLTQRQDLYQAPISRLIDFIIKANDLNPTLNLEVFVHKTEALSDDYKIENFRQIQQRTLDELLDESEDYAQIPVNFHLTSVYDHSLHEAFSRVLQNKLMESLPYIEDLLNVFCTVSLQVLFTYPDKLSDNTLELAIIESIPL